MNIYDITGDLLTLQDLLENEVIDPQLLADTIADTKEEFTLKVEDYCKIIKNLEGNINSIKDEVERLTNKRKTLENNIKRMKETMFNCMEATQIEKVKGDLFTVSIQNNGGKLPVILNVDVENLHSSFVRVIKEPNMDSIREHLEKHPKCRWATLGERGKSLRIK